MTYTKSCHVSRELSSSLAFGGQAAVRPSLLQQPGGHTISRRSAAAGGADAPSVTSKTARRTANTLTNASDPLSCSWWTVVRAKCTAAWLLPRWHQQPTQQEQQEAAGEADEQAECAQPTAFADRDDCGLRGLFLLIWGFRGQNFPRLRRAKRGFA